MSKPLALILEDQGLIALDVESSLQEAGFNTSCMTSIRDTRHWLEGHTPAVAIVDIELADGSCEEVVERLHALQVPFIVHSGDPKSMHAETVFRMGQWLSKPADIAEIASLARQLSGAI